MSHLRSLYRIYQQAHIPLFAAALSYYALFSLMPLLFLLIGIFGFLLAGNAGLEHVFLSRLASLTLSLFPTQPQLAQAILHFLTRGAAPLTLGSLVVLAWSSSNFFAALAYALAIVFESPPGFRGRIAGLLAPAILGFGLILISLIGLGLAFLFHFLPTRFSPFEGFLERALPLLGAGGLFFLTYRWLPPHPPRTLPALVASFCATLVWEVLRRGIPQLLPRSHYEVLYGPLAGLLLGLLGFYLTMWILLSGAALAHHLDAQRSPHETDPPRP